MTAVADVADNCPDDANANQDDSDLDLIGDVCDPFPFDRDNEQAQCEEDLDIVLTELDECRNPPTPTPTASPVPTPLPQCSDGIDNDGDGRIDWPDDRQCKSAGENSESRPNR